MSQRRLSDRIFQDLAANRGDPKAQLILICFRSASEAIALPRVFRVPILRIYRVVVDWILGVEIPPQTKIGPGLRLHHAHCVVINGAAELGCGVEIHQGVTIGARRGATDCPKIGDFVRIGTGAILLGDIVLGNGAQVGAGAVVLRDVGRDELAVGNPARIVQRQTR